MIPRAIAQGADGTRVGVACPKLEGVYIREDGLERFVIRQPGCSSVLEKTEMRKNLDLAAVFDQDGAGFFRTVVDGRIHFSKPSDEVDFDAKETHFLQNGYVTSFFEREGRNPGALLPVGRYKLTLDSQKNLHTRLFTVLIRQGVEMELPRDDSVETLFYRQSDAP